MAEDLMKRFEKQVEEADWESIAQMAMIFQIEFEEESSEVKSLKKKISMTRKVLHAVIKEEEVGKASFFRGLVKTIDDLDKALGRHSTRRNDFLIFLKVLLKKIRREKLVAVKKIMQRKRDFQKMKKAGDKV